MASNILVSTGLKKMLFGSQSLRDILRGGRIDIYGGVAGPDSADKAATGTKLLTITRASLSAKVAQVMRITPTAGTAVSAEWRVTVNGDTVVFTDDGTPSASEICTGLTNLLNVLAGGAITTPAGTIEAAKNDGKFTVTNNGDTLDITSAVAGVPIDVSSEVAGAGAGSGTLVTSTQTEDAYGISLEEFDDIASGIIEKTSGEVWSGVGISDGTATYFRYVADSDDATLSTSQPRIQGVVATANAPLIIKNVNIYTGATTTVDTFQIQA